ncbi:PIN domain nuclease [Actinobacteria bacterium YIM 96077]|uniref:Ribonuclease VapC n=1 Tax=Phytoactinopolyspora halophila TaxID=1981511 RepID=A0A329QDB5_9ACTN|nr:PIN domain nuclease [Phytoactinopolyspora halophila]AYY13040.1 PIN domain nuclease [Actinobacteria bacterium YIM 96077]RAW09699.1 VapC toxin family PIN domain ribonuclease [Phytoactinopolyspora halophila]
MGVSPARWLIDKSVLARIGEDSVAEVVLPRVQAGLVGVSIVTELEVGFSARSINDYRTTRDDLLDHLFPVLMPARAEFRAREIQAWLVERGEHRSAGVADLLLAAMAEIEGLTILHYDADFETIASVTGQSTEWVVPRGSVA